MPRDVAVRRLAATARHLNVDDQGATPTPPEDLQEPIQPSIKNGSIAGGVSRPSSFPIINLTILGCGVMGTGLAEIAISRGFKVTLWNHLEPRLHKARTTIMKGVSRRAKNKFLEDSRAQENFVSSLLSSFTTTTDLVQATANADMVIETIIEDMGVKQELFDIVDRTAKPHCIFTTNTSGLALSELGSKLSPERRIKFGGLHFFNPVSAMKLVEVVRTIEVSDEVYQTLFDFARCLGKVPVKCKDTPGFIVNRLLIPYMHDAFAMRERGDATAEDIDIAMRLGAGYPKGPLELSDFVGLDTAKSIGDGWRKRAANGDTRVPLDAVKPSPLMGKLVAEGKLGVKTGHGVYKYPAKPR